MKERPILFSAPMIRAILAGQKTQTRRSVLKQPTNGWSFDNPPVFGRIISPHPKRMKFGAFVYRGRDTDFPESDIITCPYGQPGNRLWVREAHAPQPDCWGAWSNWNIGDCKGPKPVIHYRADGGRPWVDKWRPSIHMPRWASRILLEIVSVRVERLQDISEADSVAEGCQAIQGCEWRTFEEGDAGIPMHKHTAIDAYSALWDAINGPGSWEANPWVWAVEFKKLEGGAA